MRFFALLNHPIKAYLDTILMTLYFSIKGNICSEIEAAYTIWPLDSDILPETLYGILPNPSKEVHTSSKMLQSHKWYT